MIRIIIKPDNNLDKIFPFFFHKNVKMFQNLSWLLSLIFLPVNTAAPYSFGRLFPHFAFVFPQHDVITFNMTFSYQHYDVITFNIIFSYQHYVVITLKFMSNLHIWSAVELI
jgi:hypothetical protein